MRSLFVIIYDGIHNSVFQSQVVMPLLTRISTEPDLSVHIISFERDPKIIPPIITGITFHIIKRFPFIHRICVITNVIKLRLLLKRFNNYELLARGPFAGYIAYKAATPTCNGITVQVRGLAAEEYRYSCGINMNFTRCLHYKLYLALEQYVYRLRSISFDVVSPALKEYIISEFHTSADTVTLAQHDLPIPISPQQRQAFRTAKRTELNLGSKTVYCYSGSFKPWQCPQETIEYFVTCYARDNQSFLLICTPDIKPFQAALEHAPIPSTAYHIISVAPQDLFAYLAAADYGLLLREKHIINFVSRPTKALEYQAAGLIVLHNDTVPYVAQMTCAQSIL